MDEGATAEMRCYAVEVAGPRLSGEPERRHSFGPDPPATVGEGVWEAGQWTPDGRAKMPGRRYESVTPSWPFGWSRAQADRGGIRPRQSTRF